jgi:hypothetical protein
MKKLSVGLLAAVVMALATAPADAAKKKKAGAKPKKGKAEVAQNYSGPTPLGDLSCWLTGATGTKSPGPACGR